MLYVLRDNNKILIIYKDFYDQLLIPTIQYRMHVIHGFLGLTNRSTHAPLDSVVNFCPMRGHVPHTQSE